MQKIKNNILALISCVLLASISGLNILIRIICNDNPSRQIITILIGVLLILCITFLKEKHLYNLSFPVYLFSVILLIAQWIVEFDYYSFDRFTTFDTFSLITATLLPLCCVQVSKTITEYKNIPFERIILFCFLIFFPTILAMRYEFFTTIVITAVVCAVILMILKKEKRHNIPWRAFIIAATLICIIFLAVYSSSESLYFKERFDVILTRGASDPYGAGWIRTVIDVLFKSSHLIGATESTVSGYSIIKTLNTNNDYSVLIILAQYGWLAFFSVISLFVCFFVCIFKMIAKIKQSAFARYTSLICGLALIVQALYSLFGLVFLDCSSLNFTFLGGISITLINYVLFGLILVLYLKRDEPSEIEELEYTDDDSILTHLKNILYYLLLNLDEFDDNSDL